MLSENRPDENEYKAHQFNRALQGGYPMMWRGETTTKFPLESYLKYADEVGDNGGELALSQPSQEGPSQVEVFDGAVDRQRMVYLSLSDFLALSAGRSGTIHTSGALRQRGEAALSAAMKARRSDINTPDTSSSVYACQVPLAGGSAPPRSPLRSALAAGAQACIPAWATPAVAAAERAFERSFGDSNEEEESAASSSSSSVQREAAAAGEEDDSSLNAWICAGASPSPPLSPPSALASSSPSSLLPSSLSSSLSSASSSSSSAASMEHQPSLHSQQGMLMRTECHFDGYQNFMCVLEGCKMVELWPPGEAALCRTAPAWAHHVPPGSFSVDQEKEKEERGRPPCPPAAETFVLKGGDVAFWPEGWWHRVTSEPATRAVNVWWRGCRPWLVGGGAPAASARAGAMASASATIPDPIAPFALRTLAHHCCMLLLKEKTADGRKADVKAYRSDHHHQQQALLLEKRGGVPLKPASTPDAHHPQPEKGQRRFPLLVMYADQARNESTTQQRASQSVAESKTCESKVTKADKSGDDSRSLLLRDDGMRLVFGKRQKVATFDNEEEDKEEEVVEEEVETLQPCSEEDVWRGLLLKAASGFSSSTELPASVERVRRSLRLGSVGRATLMACRDHDCWLSFVNSECDHLDDFTAFVVAQRWCEEDAEYAEEEEAVVRRTHLSEEASADLGNGPSSSSTSVQSPSTFTSFEDQLFSPLQPGADGGAVGATKQGAINRARATFFVKKERFSRDTLAEAVAAYCGLEAPIRTPGTGATSVCELNTVWPGHGY